ncbi:MAG: hypothetical protein HDS78_00165 [Bacteroidales bacterium]|nr:hypothetical protein [Bacteroidales bacterium]
MKTKIIILFVILYQLLTASAFAQTVQVTSADALGIAHKQFEGRDVDYYLVPDSTSWLIFVDAMPQANWMHECYLLTIPKISTVCTNQIIPETEALRMPPDGIEPLDVKRRYDPNGYKKPVVKGRERRIE